MMQSSKPRRRSLMARLYGWRHGLYNGVFLAIAGSILWILGWPETWEDPSSVPPWFPDRIFFMILLFLGQTLEGTRGNPWPLMTMSLVAVLFSLSAVLQIMFSVVSRFWTWVLMVTYYRNHHIVCGMSQKGIQLARALQDSGRKVVVIEQNPDHPRIDDLRAEGIRVHVGDGTSGAVLLQAGLLKAQAVYCSCDDEINFEISHEIETVCQRKRAPLPERHIHVWSQHLYEELQLHELSSRRAAHRASANLKDGRVHFYSLGVLGANRLVDWLPVEGVQTPLLRGDGAVTHFVIIGAGSIGQEFAVQCARRWAVTEKVRYPHTKPCFHIVDQNAQDIVAEMEVEHPNLSSCWELKAHPYHVPGAGFNGGDYLKDGPADIPEPTRVLVALPSDLDSVSAGLSVMRQVTQRRWQETLVVVRLTEDRGLMWCDALCNNNTPWCRQLQPFKAIEEVLSIGFARYAPPEQIAIALHEVYLKQLATDNAQRVAEGKEPYTPEEKPAGVPWEILGEEHRESSRLQAASILLALAQLPVPRKVGVAGIAQEAPLTPEDLEHLARNEHDRWMAERSAQGWKPGTERDNDQLLHPDMVPWDQLSEKAKNYDRAMVAAWPDALKQGGLVVESAGGKAARTQ